MADDGAVAVKFEKRPAVEISKGNDLIAESSAKVILDQGILVRGEAAYRRTNGKR